MGEKYSMSYEIFKGIHKAWEEFKTFCKRDPNARIFVMGAGAEVGRDHVVCKICTGLGTRIPGAICLCYRGGVLNDAQKANLRSLVSKVRAASAALRVETVDLSVRSTENNLNSEDNSN